MGRFRTELAPFDWMANKPLYDWLAEQTTDCSCDMVTQYACVAVGRWLATIRYRKQLMLAC